MAYLYFLGWISLGVQLIGATLAIAAGLYYLAEIMEEYASVAKKWINMIIVVDTVLALGLLVFEDRYDMPLSMVLLAVTCNLCYFQAIRKFPIVEIVSPSFILSIVLFIVHNYVTFGHFSSHYLEFSKILCYLTLFCWLVPIILLVSCSANDNVLPTTYSQSNRYDDNSNGLMNNYFKSSQNKKIGLLSFFRSINKSLLPTVNSGSSNQKAY